MESREDLKQQVQRYETMMDITLRFADVTLKAPDLQSLIRCAAPVLKNPVIVYDEFFNVLISPDARLEEYERDPGTLEKYEMTNLFYYRQRVVFSRADAPAKECTRLLFPVLLEDMAKGYLAIFDTCIPCEKIDLLALEVFANFALVEMKRLLDLKNVEEKYISDFLYDVIYRKENKREEIRRRAKVLNLADHADYCIVAVNVMGRMKNIRLDTNGYITQYEYMSDRIMNNTGNLMRSRFPQDIITKFDRTIIVLHRLHQNGAGETTEELKKTCGWLLEQLRRLFDGMNVQIGIGTVTDGFEGIAASYHHALSSISYGGLLHSEGDHFIISYDESSLLKVFGKLKETDSLDDMIPEALHQLREWDAHSKSNFYNTLKTYLDCNCNAKKASEKLFIHYKTMLYRLEKLQNQFRINLEDRASRLNIELGIQMLDIMDLKQQA